MKIRILNGISEMGSQILVKIAHQNSLTMMIIIAIVSDNRHSPMAVL